jgi:hypothetical protein
VNARRIARTLALVSLLSIPSLALAQQASLKVQVAQVSNQGTQVDEPLKQLAADFKRNGLSFSSFKLVGSENLSLAPGQSGTIKLPNGQATVTFVRKEGDGKLTIKVAAPSVSTEVALDRELTLNVGEHGGGKLFLIVRK